MDNFEITMTIKSQRTDEHRLDNVAVKMFASPEIFFDAVHRWSHTLRHRRTLGQSLLSREVEQCGGLFADKFAQRQAFHPVRRDTINAVVGPAS
jgi:hypothetical protein